jgi:DNA-directed RNA polymerase
MMWTSAIGFPVVHASRKQKAVRLSTADHKILIYEEDEKQKIDVRQQQDGVVPHFVHSQDSAHMMLTTNHLHALGLRHFAMVHDSFGVHACDVDLLNRVLREEFVGIYSEPVLQRFIDELRRDNPDLHLPDPPAPGPLDIRQVLSSLYFFA